MSSELDWNLVDFEIFSTNYGVCFECHWETDRDMSDEQIRELIKQHWLEEHPWCIVDQEIYEYDCD